jgi:adsorption protein B
VAAAELLSRVAAELALFAGAGFLLFAINDLLVDLIYFARLAWREVTVYTRYPRAFADGLGNAKTLSEAVAPAHKAGFIAILVPAWDEAAVIASMLRATLSRLDYPAYTIFVGYYRNDPATLAAIASIKDARIEAVEVDADGPTTKADCLNHLYGIM